MNNNTINWENPEVLKLVAQYNQPGPRYTSYPPATFFTTSFNSNTYIEQVKTSNHEGHRNLSFYFHIPFCPQLCYFCGCNTTLAQGAATTEKYIDALMSEFRQVAQYIDSSRKVSQIHWGGGTPNSISLRHIERVIGMVKDHFTLTDDCEIAMECNPAYMDYKQADALADMGFNRISIGIQDFDNEVLKRINRLPSKLLVEDLVQHLNSRKISVNFDFVYGLPGQSPESFEQNMLRASAMHPGRIVAFSYAHVPWVKAAQKELEKYTFPDANTKMAMYNRAYNKLVDNGYLPIGLDHFALPDDPLAISANYQQLHRNFMGYCSLQNTGQVYAFGATAISQLYGGYAQNCKDTHAYIQTIEKEGLAIERGYVMTELDKMGQMVIESLMCNQYVDFNRVAEAFQVDILTLFRYLKFNPGDMIPLIDDGLVLFDGYKLQITPIGRLFMRNVAMLFDPRQPAGQTSVYSKTI